MADIRVMIVEDQTLVRQGLHTILDLSPGFTVVGEAENGQQAIEKAQTCQPEVILMDVQMPHVNGIEATAQIVQTVPTAKVILLTTFDYDEYVFAGILAGARGYMLKDIPAVDLLDTIRRVHEGESIVQPRLAMRLITAFSQRHSETQAHSAEPLGYEPLSARELEVLRLLAEGRNNREIAAQLVLTEGTVKNYVSEILDKLHAANRTHAATIARKQGLID